MARSAGFGRGTATASGSSWNRIEADRVPELVAAIVAAGGRVEAVIPEHQTLEERFLELLASSHEPDRSRSRWLTLREAVASPARRGVRRDHHRARRPERMGLRPAQPQRRASPRVRSASRIPQALILFMFMFSFVVALSASAMASPAISAEAESGVLLSIVTRPVQPSQILLGKWLGLAAVLLAYAAVVSGLEVGVVDWVSGFVPPNPAARRRSTSSPRARSSSRSRCCSARGCSAIATGVVGDRALRGGVAGRRRRHRSAPPSRSARCATIGDVARYILPTDGLWHGAIYYLEPQSFVAQRLANSPTRPAAIRSSHRRRPRGPTSSGSVSGSSPCSLRASSASSVANSESGPPAQARLSGVADNKKRFSPWRSKAITASACRPRRSPRR